MKKLFICSLLIIAMCSPVSAQTPQFYNSNSGTAINTFPFGVQAGKKVQWLIAPREFNKPWLCPPGIITKLYFRMAGSATTTFSSLTIKFGQTSLTSLPTGVIYTGPLDTVYYRSSVTLSSSPSAWMSVNLDHPFSYDTSQSLVIDVSQCGASASGMNIFQVPVTSSTFRRNYINHNGGCTFTYQGQDANIANCGIDIFMFPSSVNQSLVLPTPGSTANYISIPYANGMSGFQNITIEAWVKPGSSATQNTIMNKGASSYDYQFGINSTSTGFVYLRAVGTVVYSTFTVSPGVWTHLAVTSSGSSVRFYKNGIPLTTLTSSLTLGNTTGELRIGRGDIDPGSGKIDEVRIWNVVRTPAQILANMCNKWIPNSSSGLLGKWHLDNNLIDSVHNWNGNAVGNIAFDTAINCIVTGINKNEGKIPEDFQLFQNFPNPFNPVTTIKFSIPKDTYVELTIYDINGKEISTITSDPYTAGTYSIDFDASKFSSGIYFYKISAGEFSNTKKMILIK